ncbi:MAG: hypothetical protein SO160_12405 [Lachnospiraceae bacterium]|nr:hypothetical protein [Lachnospiraceae bacterium]
MNETMFGSLLSNILANELMHIGMQQQAERVCASRWENLQGVPNENKLPVGRISGEA